MKESRREMDSERKCDATCRRLLVIDVVMRWYSGSNRTKGIIMFQVLVAKTHGC